MNLPGLLILLGLGLALGWGAIVLYTFWLLRHPPRRTYAWAVARQLPGDPSEVILSGSNRPTFSSWTFRSQGLELPVWDIPGARADGGTLIITHGWADSRISMLDRLPALHPHFARIILWDMPAHGEAPGACTLGIHESSALRALIDRTAGARPLVLYGFSLGATVSLHAASDNPAVHGLVLEAPYRQPWTPAFNVLRLRALPYRSTLAPAMVLAGLRAGAGLSWWPRSRGASRTDAVTTALQVRQTALVLHSRDDEISPLADGRDIAAALPASRLYELAGALHQDLWRHERTNIQAAQAVTDLLDLLQSSPSSGTQSSG